MIQDVILRPAKKYGHLTVKDAEATPWNTLYVDLVGPYKVTLRNKKNITLLAISVNDHDTNF